MVYNPCIAFLPGGWLTYWKQPDELLGLKMPEGDYRDRLPTRTEDVARVYEGTIQDGVWTMGLLEMWAPRNRLIKTAVHVPCCPSFRFNPLRWRGPCFGRTGGECYWFAVDRTRWARVVHAVGLGREYTYPFAEVGKGTARSEMCALCWFTCMFGIIASAGIGQGITVCGNIGPNFAACYTCHAREKIRRRFNLPPTFGLPPGFDDCCTHFCCMYCSSHQELRELLVRGLDGPGISPLDVNPSSWKHVPGFQEEMEHRRNKLHMLREQGDLFLPFEQRMTRDYRGVSKALHSRRHRRGKSGTVDPNIPIADTLPSGAVKDYGPKRSAETKQSLHSALASDHPRFKAG
ncbi:hypothetical protein WJX84_009716 [Apatococcus fuscideae]|uniref:Uncharacterized protein n=1 Tax=Apatococcus fuscideae TaxID=2026836 RepID=A0AAW1SNG8_9CHLO